MATLSFTSSLPSSLTAYASVRFRPLPSSILVPFVPPSRFRSIAFRSLMANARSGMGVDDSCKTTFMELQRKKMHRYIVFKLDEKKKKIVVEKIGHATESYDDFTALLPEKECRYAVYDFDFVTEDNCQKSKIFFIAWSPDVSGIRTKFLYATSKDKFRQELNGVHYEVQASDPTEVDIEVLRGRAN